jgi:hypothetical protein
LPDQTFGAQRASSVRHLRSVIVAAFIAVLALGGALSTPPSTLGAGVKIVIVVGPTHSATARYIDTARYYADVARSYGASVTEIYSPNATWSRVRSAAQGANVLVYLGHGNGWPSPYAPFSKYTKDGMGLNATAGAGNANTKYYGEYYIDRYIQLAPNAVVILNHLCYASGNSEPGRALPTKSTAMRRVDNFGAGFLRAGARAVFAEGHGSAAYVIRKLFTGNSTSTMKQIFYAAPNRVMRYNFAFYSSRTPGMTASMDPEGAGRYYRSAIGKLSMTIGAWRP